MSGVRGRWQTRSAPAPPCRDASGIWTKKLARADDSLYFALQSLSVSSVTDLHKALAEIHSFRGQLARNAEIRGYGPATLAATGALAPLAASASAFAEKPRSQDRRVSRDLDRDGRAVIDHHQHRDGHAFTARSIRSGDGNDSLRARAVFAWDRRRFSADRGAAALRTAESLDASGLVAGAIQHGCICLVPISSAPDVIRLPGSR